jgi:hypothetical protein
MDISWVDGKNVIFSGVKGEFAYSYLRISVEKRRNP